MSGGSDWERYIPDIPEPYRTRLHRYLNDKGSALGLRTRDIKEYLKTAEAAIKGGHDPINVQAKRIAKLARLLKLRQAGVAVLGVVAVAAVSYTAYRMFQPASSITSGSLLGSWRGSVCGVSAAEIRITQATERGVNGTVAYRGWARDNSETQRPPLANCSQSGLSADDLREAGETRIIASFFDGRSLRIVFGEELRFPNGYVVPPPSANLRLSSGNTMEGTMTEYEALPMVFTRER